MEEEIENKGSRYVTEDRCVPDLQSSMKEMRRESSRMHCERVPLLQNPAITLPQLLLTL